MGHSTMYPRGNVIDMGDVAGGIGIESTRMSMAQMVSTTGQLNYLANCASYGIYCGFGSGAQSATNQGYGLVGEACGTDYAADTDSWYT